MLMVSAQKSKHRAIRLHLGDEFVDVYVAC